MSGFETALQLLAVSLAYRVLEAKPSGKSALSHFLQCTAEASRRQRLGQTDCLIYDCLFLRPAALRRVLSKQGLHKCTSRSFLAPGRAGVLARRSSKEMFLRGEQRLRRARSLREMARTRTEQMHTVITDDANTRQERHKDMHRYLRSLDLALTRQLGLAASSTGSVGVISSAVHLEAFPANLPGSSLAQIQKRHRLLLRSFKASLDCIRSAWSSKPSLPSNEPTVMTHLRLLSDLAREAWEKAHWESPMDRSLQETASREHLMLLEGLVSSLERFATECLADALKDGPSKNFRGNDEHITSLRDIFHRLIGPKAIASVPTSQNVLSTLLSAASPVLVGPSVGDVLANSCAVQIRRLFREHDDGVDRQEGRLIACKTAPATSGARPLMESVTYLCTLIEECLVAAAEHGSDTDARSDQVTLSGITSGELKEMLLAGSVEDLLQQCLQPEEESQVAGRGQARARRRRGGVYVGMARARVSSLLYWMAHQKQGGEVPASRPEKKRTGETPVRVS